MSSSDDFVLFKIIIRLCNPFFGGDGEEWGVWVCSGFGVLNWVFCRRGRS